MGKLGGKARAVKQPFKEEPTSTSPWLPQDQRSKSRDQKREAVLKTAAQLFCLQGFHNTTLTDIARQLHITKPAIYHYFSSKDDILEACVREALAATEGEYKTASQQGTNGRERLQHFMTWYAENMTTVFGMCLVRISEQDLEPKTRDELHAAKQLVGRRIRQLLEQGVADGSIAPCNVKVAVFTIAGALSWVGQWYKPGGRLSPREVAESVVELLTTGLGPRPTAGKK
jgi:AcrR family transcriptional regulator